MQIIIGLIWLNKQEKLMIYQRKAKNSVKMPRMSI
jgi:hypothetical protein